MELALQLTKNIGALFIILLIGAVFVKTKLLKPEDTKTVSKLIIYMAMPSSIIKSFQVECTPERLADFGVALLGALVCQLVFMGISAILKHVGKFDTIERMGVAYPNVGNLIVPLVSITLGEEWVLFTAAYTGLQNVFNWTHQVTVISGQKMNLKKIVLNVNIIAIAAGLLMFVLDIKLPEILGNACSISAATLGPLSMFMIGMSIAAANLKEIFSRKRLYGVLLMRMIVCPVIMALILRFSGMIYLTEHAPMVLVITVMSAAAPISALTAQLAQLYDNQPGYAGALNLSTTICCIVTMPLMVAFYQFLLTV